MNVRRVLRRARLGIVTIGAAYLASLLVGLIMVHSGNRFALAKRDHLVQATQGSSSIEQQFQSGHRLRAGLLDFAGNTLGGFATSFEGFWWPASYPLVAYRGWVGGIVSVDGRHRSRLRQWPETLYFVGVIILQLVPYTLAGGAGVNIGFAYSWPAPWYQGRRFWGVPVEAVRDAARIYVLVIPLFLVASLAEFLT